MAGTRGNPANFFQHPAPLGANLYDRGRVRVVPPAGRQLGPGVQAGSLSSIPAPESTSAIKVSTTGECGTLLCCAVLYMPLVVCRSLPYQHSHPHAYRVPSAPPLPAVPALYRMELTTTGVCAVGIPTYVCVFAIRSPPLSALAMNMLPLYHVELTTKLFLHPIHRSTDIVCLGAQY